MNGSESGFWPILLLSLLAWLVEEMGAEYCEPEKGEGGKRCPDFKDAPDRTHCCSSKFNHGEFICCPWEKKQEELGLNQLPNLGVIVGSIGGGVVVLFLTVLYFCCCRPSCPLYRWRRKRREASMYGSGAGSADSIPPTNNVPANSRITVYHALTSREPPKPGIYEAPPPYPFAHRYPTNNPTVVGGRSPHLDNLLNEARISSPTIINTHRSLSTSSHSDSDDDSPM